MTWENYKTLDHRLPWAALMDAMLPVSDEELAVEVDPSSHEGTEGLWPTYDPNAADQEGRR